MAYIVDQYGKPIISNDYSTSGRGLLNASSRNTPPLPSIWEDIDKSVPIWERRQVCSAGRQIYIGNGLVNGALTDISTCAVGNAWKFVSLSSDKGFAKEAEHLINEVWMPACDVRGDVFDFHTNLFLDSTNLGHTGDFGVVLFADENGWPTLQHIPSHRIGSRFGGESKITSGTYARCRERDGVIYTGYGTPVAYRVVRDELEADSEEEIIPRQSFIFAMDPTWFQQGRGVPSFLAAIREYRTVMKAEEWEEMAAVICSMIALIEENETGTASDETNMFRDVIADGNKKMVVEDLFGGMIRRFKAGTGSRLTAFKSERPGEQWESFQDRLLRAGAAALNWPLEMVWKMEGLNGNSVRAIQGRARRTIADRITVLAKVARREINFALSCFVARGDLPAKPDFLRYKLTQPARLTIDDGRDASARRDDYKLGIVNMHKILADEDGGEFEDHVYERAEEEILWEKARIETETKYGGLYKIDPNKMRQFTPNAISQPAQDKCGNNNDVGKANE